MVTLTYHGHSCWEIASDAHRVLIDPFLSDSPTADVKPDAFTKLDAILITHGHFDHIGDAAAIARKTGALVVGIFEVASYLEKQGCKVHPMNIGGGHDFDFGRVKLTVAHHSSTGPNGESLGDPAGIVLNIGGKTIYHTGDTAVFLDMKLIAELNGPFDATMLPIGDNFTMGIRDAVKATELIGAKVALPMHYGTFGVIDVDPQAFVSQVQAAGRQARVVRPGESITI